MPPSKLTERQFITGLFQHDELLHVHFLVDKCAKQFGSFQQGLYIVADALANGFLTETSAGDVRINRE